MKFYAVIKMASHTDHCVLFARHCMNDVSVVLNKHSSNNYYSNKSDYKDEALSNDFLRVVVGQLFPHIITPA